MPTPLSSFVPVPDDMVRIEWACPTCHTSWFTKPGVEPPECTCDSDCAFDYVGTRVDAESFKLYLQDREQRARERKQA